MAQIAVVGSVNMDLVVRAPRFALAGETILGQSFRTVPGGKGANQAVAAQRLGAAVALIGRVGADQLGATLSRGLAGAGVDTRHLAVTPAEATGVALITVADDGENTIVVVPGANSRLAPEDVAAASPAITAAQVLLLQLEVPLPTVARAARIAHEHGVTVLLNAAPARPLAPALLACVDYLVVNETEAQLAAGAAAAAPEAAARAAQALGAGTVVVTLGARGALLVPPGAAAVAAPGFAVRAVDTTAAGDAFVGAFAVALAQGMPAAAALRRANAAGALAVTREGAQPSLPDLAALEAFLGQA